MLGADIAFLINERVHFLHICGKGNVSNLIDLGERKDLRCTVTRGHSRSSGLVMFSDGNDWVCGTDNCPSNMRLG